MTFECWAADFGETRGNGSVSVKADDAESAAEHFAEDFFNADATTPKDMVVTVFDPRDGTTFRFDVEPDFSVTYRARRAK